MKYLFFILFLLLILGCKNTHKTNNITNSSYPNYSGIFPHLAFFNSEFECGTGAVVPWARKLWVVTYAPNAHTGSDDKLYEISPNLQINIRPESIGGTPANRMIHKESQQLFIGPYAIDKNRNVRTIPYTKAYGRPTGNARHLTNPKNKIYLATMEEGFYEIDVHSLKVKTLYKDTYNKKSKAPKSGLFGYHGKGLYSSQARVVYSNNGQWGKQAKINPFTPSGALATWNGKKWKEILRKQFVEVTGPGGIYGNKNPKTDPIWATGWDAKSVILMLLENGKWHKYRLPKASHSYDGAHGWNTEWPRIREIGQGDNLLMTMHGMFWNFPKTFSSQNSKGIRPLSSYLKVIGDFARWQDYVVFGCDDTARSQFLNKRRAKGHLPSPQSQSNLWFIKPNKIDEIGTVIGRGAIWLNEKVVAKKSSTPYLFDGFRNRAVHLYSDRPTQITIELDKKGNGQWSELTTLNINGYLWYNFNNTIDATWIRLSSNKNLNKAIAWFTYGDYKQRYYSNKKFKGLANTLDKEQTKLVGGLIRATDFKDKKRGLGKPKTLHFAAINKNGKIGNYYLNEKMQLINDGNDKAWSWMQKNAKIPPRKNIIEEKENAYFYTDDNDKKYLLPKNSTFKENPLGKGRICREVATERDLFNLGGTFFELPANNAAGFKRIRPVSTHNLQIYDYCSYRGLFVISGINLKNTNDNKHIIKSEDKKVALWVGAIDDIWQLGKPIGIGGPWLNSYVAKNEYSLPYLMTGYDKKSLSLKSSKNTIITVEVDISGFGNWQVFKKFQLEGNQKFMYNFNKSFQAYWIRFKTSKDSKVSVILEYK